MNDQLYETARVRKDDRSPAAVQLWVQNNETDSLAQALHKLYEVKLLLKLSRFSTVDLPCSRDDKLDAVRRSFERQTRKIAQMVPYRIAEDRFIRESMQQRKVELSRKF